MFYRLSFTSHTVKLEVRRQERRKKEMKILYSAGQMVRKGTYLDPVSGLRTDLDVDGLLPGADGKRFLRLPPGGMIPVAFVIGILYVLVLPFIGVATLISIYIIPLFGVASGVLVVSGRAIGAFLALVGRSVSFGWRPSSAYLAGRRRKRVVSKNQDVGGKEEKK
jgi:hypothetical protein